MWPAKIPSNVMLLIEEWRLCSYDLTIFMYSFFFILNFLSHIYEFIYIRFFKLDLSAIQKKLYSNFILVFYFVDL